MKIKLSDIAKEMGISTAAVSMAVNNKPGVSEETRLEVLKVAGEMGYIARKPATAVKIANASASKKFIKLLRIKKHGLVVMETAFFAKVIDGIEEQCKKMGYELLISNITIDPNEKGQIVNEFHDDVDGLIALCTELDEEDVIDLVGLKCPKVILDRRFQFNVDTVLMNNQKATNQGVEFLYGKGHRKIGYLRSSTSIYNFESRFRGFVKVMESKELDISDDHIAHIEPTIDGAYKDMMMYLNEFGHDLPTAFIADNDNIALGAINALKEKNIKIPEDISIVGIDDMPFCSLISPQLTTIKIYKKEIGRIAVKMLVEQSKEETECSRKVEVDTTLVNRESVRDLS